MNIHTAARQRVDITRSLNAVKRDRHFSESNHAELVTFCRATGLRRAELKALRGTALYQDNSGYYLHITSGSKGGRERYAPIIGDKELMIRLCRQAGTEKVFEKIPSGADIHSYRRDYATAVYQQHARPLEQLNAKEKYYCRGDDADCVQCAGAWEDWSDRRALFEGKMKFIREFLCLLKIFAVYRKNLL